MNVKDNKYHTAVTWPELQRELARSSLRFERTNKMGLEVTKLNGCRLGDLTKNKDQCKQSVHIKGERILNHISDITGLYFSLSIRIYEYNICFMCSMYVHLRTFYTYMTNQQTHICKCAELHIIILHQHVSATYVTITLQQHVSVTHVTITLHQRASATHVTINLHQHASATHVTISETCFGHSRDHYSSATCFCHSRDHFINMFRTLT